MPNSASLFCVFVITILVNWNSIQYPQNDEQILTQQVILTSANVNDQKLARADFASFLNTNFIILSFSSGWTQAIPRSHSFNKKKTTPLWDNNFFKSLFALRKRYLNCSRQLIEVQLIRIFQTSRRSLIMSQIATEHFHQCENRWRSLTKLPSSRMANPGKCQTFLGC